MKHPMDYDTVEFLLERHSKFFGVLPYPINTNHNVTRNKVGSDIVESDNIGICIVIQELPIDLEQTLVITKKI